MASEFFLEKKYDVAKSIDSTLLILWAVKKFCQVDRTPTVLGGGKLVRQKSRKRPISLLAIGANPYLIDTIALCTKNAQHRLRLSYFLHDKCIKQGNRYSSLYRL